MLPASKILWVKNHEPEVFAKTAKFLLIEDYFIYRMTGKFATEGSLVCSSTYWDIIKKEYWPEMLECLGVKEDSWHRYVNRRSGWNDYSGSRRRTGTFKNLTVCTGALDQAAGAIGAGNTHEGMFSETIGAALAICGTGGKTGV